MICTLIWWNLQPTFSSQKFSRRWILKLCVLRKCRYFNNFEFQVCFLTRSWGEPLMFYLSKIIWCLRLAQSYLKIILNNRQCVLLLHAWWIYVKHSKRAEHAETGKFQRKNKYNNQRPRSLKNKEGDYSNIELTIIFCIIDFPFDLDASKSSEVYPAIHRSGCRALLQ